MRLKFTAGILGFALLALVITLTGCVEEPTIDPVKEPFSVMRVVNLSSNVNSMRVLVDDNEIVSGLATGSATNYMDVKSGKRRFKVFNATGDQVFNKEIEIITFDRTTVVFTGFYSSDELQNTFTNLEVPEGEVYVSSQPNAGMAHLYFVHASTAEGNLNSIDYNIDLNYTPSGDTISVDTTISANASFSFGETKSVGNVEPGAYKAIIGVSAENPVQYTDTLDLNGIQAGYRYYIFLYGTPNNLSFFKNEVVPPPIRSRD